MKSKIQLLTQKENTKQNKSTFWKKITCQPSLGNLKSWRTLVNGSWSLSWNIESWMKKMIHLGYMMRKQLFSLFWCDKNKFFYLHQQSQNLIEIKISLNSLFPFGWCWWKLLAASSSNKENLSWVWSIILEYLILNTMSLEAK